MFEIFTKSYEILSVGFSFLAQRMGRKRGKMNLEKTINKNMFNVSTAILDANPLAPKVRTKTDEHEQQESPSLTPLSSILAQPKQKLTTQFKRAITMIKQRSDPSNDSQSSSPIHATTIEKLLDSTILTSLIEEPIQQKDSRMSSTSTLTPKSPSIGHIKSQPIRSSSNQILPNVDTNLKASSTATILTLDPPMTRPLNHPNSPSARIVKQGLQQIHSSILQTMHQHHPLSSQTASSSSATLTPTSSSTIGTGEVAIRETIL